MRPKHLKKHEEALLLSRIGQLMISRRAIFFRDATLTGFPPTRFAWSSLPGTYKTDDEFGLWSHCLARLALIRYSLVLPIDPVMVTSWISDSVVEMLLPNVYGFWFGVLMLPAKITD